MFKEYIQKVLVTESCDFDIAFARLNSNLKLRLLHAAMGMVTESGEFIDSIKKNVFYGKAFDRKNLKEELGDIMWYFAVACDALGFDFEDILNCNIEKLKKRYGGEWNQDGALNRDTEKELEGF